MVALDGTPRRFQADPATFPGPARPAYDRRGRQVWSTPSGRSNLRRTTVAIAALITAIGLLIALIDDGSASAIRALFSLGPARIGSSGAVRCR
jgi:hypothetical protein